ncbi:MAG: hypothetical protein GIW99_01590 [Candidatus Eremiobacteraeota bacterium]|nr:hypothetical protein [Candidatus Eremiobacteraeota bacterium]MBC5826375.1 hypothetical protein [Candidatus Eremiobacteraeota bacterium]
MDAKLRMFLIGTGLLAIPAIAIGSQELVPPVMTVGQLSGPMLTVQNRGSGSGVFVKATGPGVYSQSDGHSGVVGKVIGNPGKHAATGFAGVFGEDATSDYYHINAGVRGIAGQYGNGVQGESNHGFGVQGSAKTGTGVYGFSASGNGVYGETNGAPNASGVTAAFFDDSYGVIGVHNNTGVYSLAGGSAFVGQGGNCDTAQCVATLQLLAARPNIPLLSAVDNGGNEVGRLDAQGNLYLKGRVYPNSSFAAASPSTGTISDVESARLTGGVAYVKIDPKFARSQYHVILTPQSDSHGLYVSSKTPGGFTVRENMGGRSTLTFDYQVTAIVASAPLRAVAVARPRFGGIPPSARGAADTRGR